MWSTACLPANYLFKCPLRVSPYYFNPGPILLLLPEWKKQEKMKSAVVVVGLLGMLMVITSSAVPLPGGFFGYGSGSGFSFPGLGTVIGGGGGAVVCSEKGPCYGKRLTCPARYFTSFIRPGFGGGGGCIVDCKAKCMAYCW